jgi:hypothetical protein
VFVSIQLYLIAPKLDIHCVSSDKYIASFYLLWISIVFCAKHGYIRSFELNWICIVFCQVDDSLNLSIGTIEHALFLIVCRMYKQ